MFLLKTLLAVLLLAVCESAPGNVVNLADGNPKVLMSLFRGFKRAEGREYASAAETRVRFGYFRNFVKDMAKLNNEDEDVEYGITFFADLSEAETQQYYGRKANVTSEAPAPEEPDMLANSAPRASSVSWKSRYGSAKQQGNCGSCWAFSATGTVEGVNAMYTGRYTALSDQETLDCTGSGNSCDGGYEDRGLQAIRSRQHMASAADYGYRGRKGSCRSRSTRNALGVRITGVYRASGDSSLARAIARGPVAIALAMNQIANDIRGYYTGVYSRRCPGRYANHALVATGYTSSYWEIRNSWGTGWGERGYFKLTRRYQNMCKISAAAHYVTVSRSGREEEQ